MARKKPDTYVVLIRGINVGGKNKVPMADLKRCLEGLGFSHVSTYIASGNVIVRSGNGAESVRSRIEAALPGCFKLDSEIIRVLALPGDRLRAIVDGRPKGFGGQPGKYHSDVIFLMGIDAARAMSVFKPREGVDRIWPGEGVVYSQRLSAQRTKSRLSAIMAAPEYKFMTIRNWNTTAKLLELAGKAQSAG